MKSKQAGSRLPKRKNMRSRYSHDAHSSSRLPTWFPFAQCIPALCDVEDMIPIEENKVNRPSSNDLASTRRLSNKKTSKYTSNTNSTASGLPVHDTKREALVAFYREMEPDKVRRSAEDGNSPCVLHRLISPAG